ncbi:MAG: thiamine-phosphate kinase [Ferroplasma sp.]
MKLGKIGEREIINILTGNSTERDDCYTLKIGKEFILLSTDLITRRTHLPHGTDPELAGKFFAAINLSDIAAMAGIPIGMLISLSVSPDYDIVYLEDFYRGAKAELAKFGAGILGGDTKEGEDFTVSGTVIGKQAFPLIRKRSYIAPGQMVMITNFLGKAGSGYIFYRYSDKKLYGIKKMMDIEPRIKEAQIISKNGAKFMMDLSDGLYASINQMKHDYGVGFKLLIDNIPVDMDVEEAVKISGFSRDKIAFDFGGDYELLFTIDRDNYSNFMEAMRSSGIDASCIGETYDGENMSYDGDWKPIKDKGFEHFKDMPLNK